MHELSGRQIDAAKIIERNAAVVSHFKKHRSYLQTATEFNLSRKKVGEIVREALDASPEQP